jgi:hypothetical protein
VTYDPGSCDTSGKCEVFRNLGIKRGYGRADKMNKISFFPKEITVHSGIVWRGKIYGVRCQICERVEVSYLLSNINF